MTTAVDMYEPTPRPQTCGNRTDMRELILSDNKSDFHLRVEATNNVRLSQFFPFRDEIMSKAKHRGTSSWKHRLAFGLHAKGCR